MDTKKRKLGIFMQVTLDGYYTDLRGDMNWAHKNAGDKEWNDFVTGNANSGGILLFGRTTYQQMESFWPTPAAAQLMPAVAERMNNLPKLVFSRTLSHVSWNNTTLIKEDLITSIEQLKATSGDTITILGSGSIVAQLAKANLIDEYAVVIVPVVTGGGRSMFAGINPNLDMKLASCRSFTNGNVLLTYHPQ